MMNQTIMIERMNESHLEGIAKLEQQCFSSPWSYEGLKTELSNERAVFFVAVQNHRVVGYAGMYHVLDEGDITNVAVDPECRRQGVADRLMNRLKQYAAEQSLSFITLEVRCSNQAAIALYQKHGFESVGLRKRFYTDPCEDAQIMTRYDR